MIQVIVRQYGLLAPLDWGEDCQEQLFLENQFWNRLVEIERDNGERYRALFGADPEYAAIEAEIVAAQAAIGAAFEAKKKERARTRSKRADEPFDQALHELLARRRALWEQQKQRRAALKPALVERLRALEAERKRTVTAARNASGLWWGNYNAVAASYDTARSRAMKTGGELRFRGFDGSGRFTNQIQGGMSVKELFAAARSQVQVEPVSERAFSADAFRGDRRRASRTKLTITAYTGRNEHGKPFRRTLTFPMILHRPIPEEVRIKEVVVTRKREGGRFRWAVTFTCTTEAAAATVADHRSRAAVGINLGWRKDTQGIRVATLVDSSGTRAYWHLPQEVVRRLAYVEELQAGLDEAGNAMRAQLAGWKSEMEFPASLAERLERAVHARSAAPLARLALAWREVDFQPAWREALERWRKADKRRRQEMENLRRKAFGLRRETYRIAAKEVAGKYALVALGQLDLKACAARFDRELKDNPLPAPARKVRVIAALSELTEWIEKQAAKSGARVEHVATPVTSTCHACGARETVDPVYVMHRCEHCGALYDQDENAARNALAAPIGAPPPRERSGDAKIADSARRKRGAG